MCGLLIHLIADVSSLVMGMRDDEAPTRQSLALATDIREQYMHQAHWLIERDDEHLEHQQEYAGRIRASIEKLRPAVSEQHQAELDRLGDVSRELERLFADELMPAARGNDVKSVMRLHKRADVLSQKATKLADGIAHAVGASMVHAHLLATAATRRGMVIGGICVLLVLTFSVLSVLGLRRSVLRPLDVLTAAAHRFGSGEFHHRLGAVGDGEIAAVAQAFDRMAEELEVREKRILEKERMAAIGQLAAGVAHEINNPIQVIRGYLKTMGPDASPETLREELGIIDEEAMACQRIVEDLLAYSRSPELQRAPVQMQNLLELAVKRFGETPEGRGIPLELAAEEATIQGDAVRLRQVVLNLLANAASAAPAGTPITAHGSRLSDGGYQIQVTDQGPGVSAADQRRVFEPFFSKRAGGTGLGLAVCQGIVAAHGGTIGVRNAPSGGAVFTVRLPECGVGEGA
jgi:signal transduction histidine kinase